MERAGMRIGELSKRADVAVPTIKYYLREGLLPAGRRTSPNQATYDEDHVHRLRLIRALVDVGGLSVARVREIIGGIDRPGTPLHDVLGAVSKTLSVNGEPADDEAERVARERVEALVAERGWRTGPSHPAIATLTRLVLTLEQLGKPDIVGLFATYAEACEQVAQAELEWTLAGDISVDERLERVVVGTVLGETAIAALRSLAHANASARLLGDGEDPS